MYQHVTRISPLLQFLAANSAGSGTSAPTRPERQENAAAMAGRHATRSLDDESPPEGGPGRPGGSLVLEGALNASEGGSEKQQQLLVH